MNNLVEINELSTDEDFFYASLFKIDVCVKHVHLDHEVTKDSGVVSLYNDVIIKVNNHYYIRSENTFSMNK